MMHGCSKLRLNVFSDNIYWSVWSLLLFVDRGVCWRCM